MARKNSAKKGKTCGGALIRNRKNVVAFFLDCLNAELSKRSYIRQIEKMCGDMEGVQDLIDEYVAGLETTDDVEKLAADTIIDRLRECLLDPDAPAPPED